MQADGTQLHNLTPDEDYRRITFLGVPVWSPTGDAIVYSSYGGVVIYDLQDETFTLITEEPYRVQAWTPGDEIVLFDGIELILLNAATHSLTPIVDTGGRIFSPQSAWSPDGTQIVYLTRQFETYTMHTFDLESRESVAIFSVPAAAIHDPSWSPDGTKIAFGFQFNRYGETYIGVVNADGTNHMLLREVAPN